MEQEKNKVPSQENENPGLEKFQRAQELYERYFISNEEADFEEMITVLDSIYKNRVKSELREKGCCDKENYEDAMQEARQGIWTRIKKQRETGELHKEFSQYCGGIYTYKAVDIAKKKNSYEQKMREVKKKGKKGKEDQKSYMEVVYLDANLPDSDGTYGELAADPNKKNRAESEVFAEESRNIFGIYLQKYCQAMTNAKAEPPRALALSMHVFCRMFFISCMGSRRFQIPREPLPHGLLNICRKRRWRSLANSRKKKCRNGCMIRCDGRRISGIKWIWRYTLIRKESF